MKNIKALFWHPWWKEFLQDIQKQTSEIEAEILIESKKSSPILDKIKNKGAKLDAFHYILSYQETFLDEWSEIETET